MTWSFDPSQSRLYYSIYFRVQYEGLLYPVLIFSVRTKPLRSVRILMKVLRKQSPVPGPELWLRLKLNIYTRATPSITDPAVLPGYSVTVGLGIALTTITKVPRAAAPITRCLDNKSEAGRDNSSPSTGRLHYLKLRHRELAAGPNHCTWQRLVELLPFVICGLVLESRILNK